MDPDTVEKLRYRLNLHTENRSPVSLGRRAKKRLTEKRLDFVETYQSSLLQEKSLLGTNKYSLEFTQKRKRPGRKGREAGLDPVQDNFIKALRERLDSFLKRPAGVKTLCALRFPPRGRQASSFTPALQEVGLDSKLPYHNSPPPYGVNLPKLTGVRYGQSIFSRKPCDSLSSVFQNQFIRNACTSQHKPSQSLQQSADTQTHEDILTDAIVGRSVSPIGSGDSEDGVGLEWTVPWRGDLTGGAPVISLSSKKAVGRSRGRRRRLEEDRSTTVMATSPNEEDKRVRRRGKSGSENE